MVTDISFLDDDRANKVRNVQHAFDGTMKYDHSVSVNTFGTVFAYDLEKPLGRAQAEIARFFGVPFAYPSTNGTTPLNVMAILSATYPGDAVLVQRDSHVSILAGLINGGLHPVYITPDYSNKLGVTLGVTPNALDEALTAHPDVRTVFLTYPNYFGIATDIDRLAKVADNHNAFLIVDSAHGSHWAFHTDAFPRRPEQAGAQIVTLSIHKTGYSLGQGSLVLYASMEKMPRLYEVASLGFVSTSFSTVILTSLINGITTLSRCGRELLSERLEMAAWARNEINKFDEMHSFGIEEAQPGFVAIDPLRLTVDVTGTGFTGYEVEEYLIDHYNLFAEMATLQNVLFLINPGVSWEDVRDLVDCMRQISKVRIPKRAMPDLSRPAMPEMVLEPREAFYYRKRQTLPIAEAIGKVSAETISAYPPGSAVVVAGELITCGVIDYLKSVRRYGGTLKGACDAKFETIQILDM